MEKAERIEDFNSLFRRLRKCAELGWNYSLTTIDGRIVVVFHGTYLGDGFDDFVKDLEELSIFHYSDLPRRMFVFYNPFTE